MLGLAVAQPPRQTLLNVGEGACAVDFEQRAAWRAEHGRRGFADLSISSAERLHARQRVKVVAQDFGAQVLLMLEPAQPANSLQIEAMLDPLERFLNSPPLMVQGGELGGRLGVRIQQICRECAHAALVARVQSRSLSHPGGLAAAT